MTIFSYSLDPAGQKQTLDGVETDNMTQTVGSIIAVAITIANTISLYRCLMFC
jgi:hypothetical protein